ncbi:hypothetical protein MASR2M48_27860 [Spirochaetota bacterium]
MVALRRLYQSKGFPDVTVVASSEVQASGNLVVTFTIDEGIRNVVESLQFEGVESISQNTLKRELKLKEKGLFQPGEFNEGKLEESRRAVETYYKNRGYVDARIVDVRREATPAEKVTQASVGILWWRRGGATCLEAWASRGTPSIQMRNSVPWFASRLVLSSITIDSCRINRERPICILRMATFSMALSYLIPAMRSVAKSPIHWR